MKHLPIIFAATPLAAVTLWKLVKWKFSQPSKIIFNPATSKLEIWGFRFVKGCCSLYVTMPLTFFGVKLFLPVGASRAHLCLLFGINILNLFSCVHCFLDCFDQLDENGPAFTLSYMDKTKATFQMRQLACDRNQIIKIRNIDNWNSIGVPTSDLFCNVFHEFRVKFQSEEWRINLSRFGKLSGNLKFIKTLYVPMQYKEVRRLLDGVQMYGKVYLLYVWQERPLSARSGMKLVELAFSEIKKELVFVREFVIQAPECFSNSWHMLGRFCIFTITDENRLVLMCNGINLPDDYIVVEYRKHECGFYSVSDEIWLGDMLFDEWNQNGEWLWFVGKYFIHRFHLFACVFESLDKSLVLISLRESLPHELFLKNFLNLWYQNSKVIWPFSLKYATAVTFFYNCFDNIHKLKYKDALKMGIPRDIADENCCSGRSSFVEQSVEAICYISPIAIVLLVDFTRLFFSKN